MKPSELLHQCARVIELMDEHHLSGEPALSLVWPKGCKGRFPIHGRLLCVNNAEDRVYSVRVADVLTFVARLLKAGPKETGADVTTAPVSPTD